MMRSITVAALCLFATAAGAQQLSPAADSAFLRVDSLVAARDSTGARALLDSLASDSASTILVRGEAAYRTAGMAASAAESERLLNAFVVDHSFSPRVASALHDLGMLALGRGDRDRAALILTRYLTASAGHAQRASASLTLGRLLLERGEVPHACAVLLNGRTEVPENSIEMKTQFEFSVGRCQGIDTSSRQSRADSPATPRATGAFTVQVAAYETRAAADKLASTLRAQGLESRVVGSAKPYRVRVGRYATRADAERASDRVDAVAKSKSIVVVVGPEEK